MKQMNSYEELPLTLCGPGTNSSNGSVRTPIPDAQINSLRRRITGGD